MIRWFNKESIIEINVQIFKFQDDVLANSLWNILSNIKGYFKIWKQRNAMYKTVGNWMNKKKKKEKEEEESIPLKITIWIEKYLRNL